MTAFQITAGKGFRWTFPNGYSLSVQWGPYNYTSIRDSLKSFTPDEVTAGALGAPNAECAIIAPDGEFHRAPTGMEGDDVEGWCSPLRVLELANYTASLP